MRGKIRKGNPKCIHSTGAGAGRRVRAELNLGDIAPAVDKLRDEQDGAASVRAALAELTGLCLLGAQKKTTKKKL